MSAGAVDVIIPVYKGLEVTRACLDSVLFAPPGLSMRVVVVDDASPEPEISAYVRGLAQRGLVTLLTNGRNLGFPASINRGLALGAASGRDAVALNSDTLVFPGWLFRLAQAAYAEPDIGTATPFSNNATICSYPRFNQDNPLPADLPPQALDGLFAARNQGQVREIPTAVGFCMYIRRDCLVDAGLLDARAFGAGYGEENDFCLRASRLGWRHVLAGDVFVAHSGAASFGAARKPALKRNLETLAARYPLYLADVREFIQRDPVAELRGNVDRARLEVQPSVPLVVRLCHGLSGGTARRLRDEEAELRAAGYACATITPDASGDGGRVRLDLSHAPDCPNLRYQLPDQMELLIADLMRFGACEVRVHHFLELPPALLQLPARLELPHDVVVHDYAWFCPRINCIDASGLFCGEPATEVCQSCLERGGADFEPQGGIEGLLAQGAALLGSARRVVAPCADAAERLMRHFTGLDVLAAPHAEPPFAPPPPPRPWDGRSVVRLAVVGGIGPHKGFEPLRACAEDAARRGLPLEFVVVGFSSDDAALYATGRVRLTGEYDEEEAVELIRRQGCHGALFLSVWPETWCYTLTQAWSAGLWAVGFGLGAVGERIRAAGWGWTMPLTADGQAINDHVLAAFSGRLQPGGC